MFVLVFQRLVYQFMLDLVLFPVWWYTAGVRRVVVGLWHSLQDANATFAPGLWLRNIFTPMFGQTDIGGRLMSVFMRIVNIIGRFLALFVWFWILLFALCAWLLLPLFLLSMIWYVLTLQ